MFKRCALCGKDINNPAECIIFEGRTFDRNTCLYIFKKLRFIYDISFIEFLES